MIAFSDRALAQLCEPAFYISQCCFERRATMRVRGTLIENTFPLQSQ